MTNYDSLTIKVPAPSGNAYVHILENKDGSIYNIFFRIGKAGSQVNAWAEGLSRMTVDNINRNGLSKVIDELSSITSSNHKRQLNGVVARSDIEAFVIALIKYKQSKYVKDDEENFDLNRRAKLKRAYYEHE